MSRSGVTGLNLWMKKTEAEKKRIKTSAQTYVRNSVRKVVKEVAKVSPQFTGNYVVNWELNLSNHQSAYRPDYKWADWHQVPQSLRMRQSANPAAGQMLTINEAIISNIKYNSRISLWNRAPVADLIEQGEVNYRPQNTKYDVSSGVVTYLLAKRGFQYLRRA